MRSKIQQAKGVVLILTSLTLNRFYLTNALHGLSADDFGSWVIYCTAVVSLVISEVQQMRAEACSCGLNRVLVNDNISPDSGVIYNYK